MKSTRSFPPFSCFLLYTILILSCFCLQTSPVYAQALENWTPIGPYTEWPFPFKRHEHAFVESQGKLYLIGGRGNKPVQIYDPQTDLWEMGAQPPIEIHHMQAVSIGSKIYIIGAQTGNFPHEDPVANVLIYDTQADSWQWGASIPENRRRGSTGAVVYQGKIYIISGIIDGHSSGWVKWADVFDPATNNWQTLPDAPNARDHFHAALVGDKIVVAGGRRSGASGTFNATVSAVDIFDISENSWSTVNSIPTQRAGCSIATIGQEVLVIGGESGSQFQAHDQVQAYHVGNNSWRTLDPLNQGRHGFQAAKLGDKIYVAAGSIERGANELDYAEATYMEVYRFDPADDPDNPDDPDPPTGPFDPVAQIQTDVTSGLAPLTVNFDGSASFDNDGDQLTFQWDFGDGTTGNGSNISHLYQQIGRYTATLTVSDGTGRSDQATTSISVLDPNQQTILFVAEMNGADQIIQDRLTGLGYSVEQVNAANAQLSQADGKAMILISSTVNSNQIQALFTEAAVPILNCEPYLFDDLLMAGPQTDTDYGIIYNQTSLSISDDGHPLAIGLSGTQQIISNTTAMSWGKPGSGASFVAAVPNSVDKAMLFAYDAGANLINGQPAPAKRIGFFFHDETASLLNNTGWEMFDAAICWATNCNPISLVATADQLAGEIPLQVSFNASASSHLYNAALSFEWVFPENTVQTGPEASFTFSEVGEFQVELLLTDGFGNSASQIFQLNALPGPPIAILHVSGDSTIVPDTVSFDANASYDTDGEIIEYIWDYGDGHADSLRIAELPFDSLVNLSLLIDSNLVMDTTITADTIVMDTILVDTISIPPIPPDSIPRDSIVFDTITTSQIEFDTLINSYVVFDTLGVDSVMLNNLWEDLIMQSLIKTHIYTQAGTFTASLTVIDNDNATSTVSETVYVLNQAPTANLTIVGDNDFAPLEVSWDASASEDIDGNIVAYLIDFGDGQSRQIIVDSTYNDSLLSGIHIYSLAGDYTFSLSVTDNLGESDTSSVAVTVINTLPIAVATATPDTAFAPVEILLSASGSTDADGQIMRYAWRGHPGIQSDSTSESMLSIPTWGEVEVYLEVEDNLGGTAQDTVNIYLPNQAPEALIQASTLSGFVPLEIQLSSLSTDLDGMIISTTWSNAQGIVATENMLSLELNTVGDYSFYLEIVDDAGASAVDTVTITVLPAPKDVLLVVGETNLNSGDQAVKARLESLGFEVIVKDDQQTQSNDAEDKAMIVISSTSVSSQVNTKFKTTATPVLSWEAYLHDDMGMTGSVQGTDYQQAYNQNQLFITDASHPLAAGLAGTVMVYNGNLVLSWGNPNEEAIEVAHLPGQPEKSVIFAYEAGSQMVGMEAPGPRVGFFLQDIGAANLTEDGWKLFDQSVCWLAGCNIAINARSRTRPTVEAEIYPNPVPIGGTIQIQLEAPRADKLVLELYDIFGKKLKSIAEMSGRSNVRFKLDGIPRGLYILKMRDKQKSWSKKIIIK